MSYILLILFFLYRRLGHPTQLELGPFRLGRWGVPCNIISLCYLVFIITWMPFPNFRPVTTSNMNYASLLVGTVIVGALVDWIFRGAEEV
jgi:hypothetical protein